MAGCRAMTVVSKRRHARVGRLAGLSMLLLAMPLAVPATAQNIIAYPERGQSREQQDRDRFDCYNWAVQQTGYNPQAQQYAATAPPSYGERDAFQGATGGAALGAIGGAIGGNAGKGAAIGALAGGLFGGFRRREAEMQEEQVQEQAAATAEHRRAGFNRAETACLRGRGYSVD